MEKTKKNNLKTNQKTQKTNKNVFEEMKQSIKRIKDEKARTYVITVFAITISYAVIRTLKGKYIKEFNKLKGGKNE